MENKILGFFLKPEEQPNQNNEKTHECLGCGRKHHSESGAQDCLKTHDCCISTKDKGNGFWSGVFYGLVPHTFCILFIVAAVIGATTMTTLFKPLMMSRNFFYILIGLSFGFATLSALFYLRKNNCLCVSGAKKRWKYLSVLYGTTIAVNLLFFFVIFPAVANISLASATSAPNSITGSAVNTIRNYPYLTLDVDIPCSGHASLIIGELKTLNGVIDAKYVSGKFNVYYDPVKTSRQQILALKVFNDYPAKVVGESQGSPSP